MNSAFSNIGAISATKGLNSALKSYASTSVMAEKMNSAFSNIGAISATKGLDSALKSYASTSVMAEKMNATFSNIGAISATKGLDSALKSYASTSVMAEKMNATFSQLGTIPAMESMTKHLDSAMKAYASTSVLAKMINSTLLTTGAIPAVESMTKHLDSAMKAYEPLMSSVVAQLDMSSLFTEVSKNFNVLNMAAYTDVSTFGRGLVGQDFLNGIISELDFQRLDSKIFDPVDKVVETEFAGEDSRVVAVRDGILILSVLIFVHFLLPYIAMFCVASAKEIADLGVAILEQADHLSKEPMVGGITLISTTAGVAVDARNRVKNRAANKVRQAKAEDTEPDS